MATLAGTTLGKYRILTELGRGGMSIVYKAMDTSLDRLVALKVLPPGLEFDTETVHRFMREARTAASLEHPGIVRIYEVGETGGVHYIAMNLLEGETLHRLIQRAGALGMDRTLGVLRQLAAALDYAHGKGIVHRDIKPSNIIIGPTGHVTITDFGLARAVSGDRVTRTGLVVGTPEYMSPEQADGKDLDRRSDLYALGVVVYEMLVGTVPFSGTTPYAILFGHLHKPPPAPTTANPSLPRGVDAALERALAKSPEARYGSAAELVAALEGAAAGRVDTGALRAPGTTVLPRPGRERVGALPWMLAAATVVSLIVLFVRLAGPPPPGNASAAVGPTATTVLQVSQAATQPALPAGVLFLDDFSSQRQTVDNLWTLKTGSDVDYTWFQGKYTLTVKKPMWGGLAYPRGRYRDLAAEVTVDSSASRAGDYGLVFRASSQSYYLFGVMTDGKYYLWGCVNGVWTNVASVPPTWSTLIRPDANTLGVIVQGDSMSLYINRTQVQSIRDDSIPSEGAVGLLVNTYKDAELNAASFSRFVVMTPERARSSWAVP